MINNSGASERMLNDDERELLAHWSTAGPDGAPIEKHAGKWTWEFRSLKAPKVYETKREAVAAFEAYVVMLLDSARVESERQYSADAMGSTLSDVELLSTAIKVSGKSVRSFARDVLVREPRTVWRWLAGENALPAAVRSKCGDIVGRDVVRNDDGLPAHEDTTPAHFKGSAPGRTAEET